MIARAPGKLVLSGAYSVLEGAVAIVCSVDLHAQADTSAPPDRVTAEVAEAIAAGVMRAAPWFDATPLRARLSDGRDIKLGVGSSAAILAASMAADWAESGRPLDRDALFEASLAAHRKAQGGGSGIDVAASVHGGFLTCTLAPDGRLTVAPHTFPGAAHIHVFATPVAASTPELLGRVRAFAGKDPPAYADLIGRAGSAAAEAAAAADLPSLLRALRTQSGALSALGDASGAPIFTPDVIALAPLAEAEGAVFYPSGAGGGDVALFVGAAPPTPRFLAEAKAFSRFPLPLATGVPGVHLVSTRSPSAAAQVTL